MTISTDKRKASFIDLSELSQSAALGTQPYYSRWSFKPLLESGVRLDKRDRSWLEKLEEQLEAYPDSPEVSSAPLPEKDIDPLLRIFFPALKRSMRFGALVRPLTPSQAMVTEDLFALLTSGNMTLEGNDAAHTAAVRAGMIILNQQYGQSLEQSYQSVIGHTDPDTNLRTYMKVLAGYDYVEVIVEGKKPTLSQKDIRKLLGNPTDGRLWQKMLPPEVFSFRGFQINHVLDATREISLGRLQRLLLKREAVLSEKRIAQLEYVLRTYLQVPDLKLGIQALDFPRHRAVSHKYLIRQDLLADEVEHILDPSYGETIYYETCKYGNVRIYDDLRDCKDDNGPLDEMLIEKGFISLVLVPLFGRGDHVIGMLELASSKSYAFNNLVLYLLESITPLFRQAIRRSRDDMEARIQSVMRLNFTALDPSIEWRFVQAAAEIIEREQSTEDGNGSPLPQIRFEDVHALYAQADIVSSSKMRNEAIQADLMADLQSAKELLESPAVALRFPLAGKLVFDINTLQTELEDGMSPNEEQHVLEFIRDELNPTLEQLEQSQGLEQRLVEYRESIRLNKKDGMSHREAYERSVRRVTSVVNNVISAAQVEAQRIVPHYFSKYRTDGVEFNIYAGQSLLQSGSFSDIHLQNLRLWQLKTMVDVTKAIAGIRDSLDMPMSTAQLIFAFGTTITIQFRMDEKRFDVEGAYNVRYEVIKKRIDKALVRGTEERLTIADHVAIVYSHHSDRQVYHELIDYLFKTQQVAGEVEDLELEPMQGVDGLHALRVRVV